jgi:hypothetical protein
LSLTSRSPAGARHEHVSSGAGLTNDDIDRMIKQAQKEVEPLIG